MAGDSRKALSFDSSILPQLACPVCFQELRLNGEWLVCTGCGRCYPIVDGIPVLIASPAESPSQTVSSGSSSISDPASASDPISRTE